MWKSILGDNLLREKQLAFVWSLSWSHSGAAGVNIAPIPGTTKKPHTWRLQTHTFTQTMQSL